MGQSSLPSLNKAGASTRWINSWDDKCFYKYKFEEDILIHIFFTIVGSKRYMTFKFGNFKKGIINLKNFYYSYKNVLIKNLSISKTKNLRVHTPKLIILYLMRFYVMRFQSTTLVFIRLFAPARTKLTPQQKRLLLIKIAQKKFSHYLWELKVISKIKPFLFSLKNF